MPDNTEVQKLTTIFSWLTLLLVLVFIGFLLMAGFSEPASFLLGSIVLPIVKKMYGINGTSAEESNNETP